MLVYFRRADKALNTVFISDVVWESPSLKDNIPCHLAHVVLVRPGGEPPERLTLRGDDAELLQLVIRQQNREALGSTIYRWFEDQNDLDCYSWPMVDEE
jgi:hypothetical protein